MPPETEIPAAAGLAAAIEEITGPTASQEPDNDFPGLDQFDELVNENETPTPTPEDAPDPNKIEIPGSEDDDDEFSDTPPGKGSEKSKTTWKELKGKATEYKTKWQESEKRITEEVSKKDSELNELREKVAKLPELEQKAAIVEEAERKLAVFNVEQSNEFKTAILDPLEAIGKNAELIAKANEIKVNDLDDALTETDPAKRRELLRAVMADMDDVDKQEVLQMARDTQALLSKQAEMRAKAFEARKELEAVTKENETKAQAAARKSFETATENSISELRKRVPFVELAEGETADAVFASILEKAKATNFDGATMGTKAFAAAAGVLLPRVTKQLVASQAKIKALEARIAADNTALPSVTGAPAGGASDDDDGDDFMGVMNKALGVRSSKIELV